MSKGELPYVVPQIKASLSDETMLESLIKHGFDTALMMVSSEADLAMFRQFQTLVGELGLSLLPIIAVPDDLLASDGAFEQLWARAFRMAKQASLMLSHAQRGDVKIALQKLMRLANKLRGNVLLLWLSLTDEALADDSIVDGIRELCSQVEPKHICIGVRMPFGDPQEMLKFAQRHFGDVSLWVALTVESAQHASIAEPLDDCIPSGDHIRIFTYAAALSGAHGVILPSVDELVRRRQDLFKAAAAVSAEAKIMARFWRGASRVSGLLNFTIECDGEPVDERSHIRTHCFAVNGRDDVGTMLSIVRWLPCTELRLPSGSCPLTVRYSLSDEVATGMPRAYLLRFPSPKRLQVRTKGKDVALSIPDFDVAESVLISLNVPLIEELHWQMNAVAASVMQFEVQQALKEFELAKAMIGSLDDEGKKEGSMRLSEMGKCISTMLNAARRRHMSRAIEAARMFRRQYRMLLRSLISH